MGIAPGSGNFVREVDVGKIIGSLAVRSGKTPTSVITILTDKQGNLVNTYPGNFVF